MLESVRFRKFCSKIYQILKKKLYEKCEAQTDLHTAKNHLKANTCAYVITAKVTKSYITEGQQLLQCVV